MKSPDDLEMRRLLNSVLEGQLSTTSQQLLPHL